MEKKKEKELEEFENDKEYMKKVVKGEKEIIQKEENDKKFISNYKKEKFKKENDELLKIKNKLNDVNKKIKVFKLLDCKEKKRN